MLTFDLLLSPSDTIDLRDDEDDGASVFRVSHSLVGPFDFRERDRSAKPSRRRR